MKNKKGFTLVEILVSISLMLSILTIAVASINSIVDQNNKKDYDIYVKAFYGYTDTYLQSIDENVLISNGNLCIKLSTLCDYTEIDIPYNPLENKKRFNGDSIVYVYYQNDTINKKYFKSQSELTNEFPGGCYSVE